MLFTRLSIIDLNPRSSQPMQSHGVWLTFNGEIYNYREVRSLLEHRGVHFRTSSDTEVLLEGYRALGWSVLDVLEGMWAFALYEESTGQLTLCRDRFGEKPLYFLRTATGLVYASETTSLGTLIDTRLKPNYQQIMRFLVNGYKSLNKGPETFFEDVAEVRAGTMMHIHDDGAATEERYWIPPLEIANDMDFAEAVHGARTHLIRSVELRLRSDVPLAFSLSGGVDSVALASLAKRELGAEVHGFTILNSDPRYEERDLVEDVVSTLGITHTGMELDREGFLDHLRAMVVHRGAPVATISFYIQWLLMKEISRAGFRVVVGGTGADEIFSGYFDHHLFYIAALDSSDRPDAVKAWEATLKPFVRNPYLQDPNRFVINPGFRDHIYLEADLFASYLNYTFAEPFEEEILHPTLLRNRMLNELFWESVPVMVHEEDLNAMTFSIENRAPYLDRRLMEFTSSIPSRLLIQNGRAKAVLREAVRDVAPDSVLNNPRKVGFNAPIQDLLDLGSEPVRAEILVDSPIYELVRKEAISSLLDKSLLLNSESKFLFSFLTCKFFLEGKF